VFRDLVPNRYRVQVAPSGGLGWIQTTPPAEVRARARPALRRRRASTLNWDRLAGFVREPAPDARAPRRRRAHQPARPGRLPPPEPPRRSSPAPPPPPPSPSFVGPERPPRATRAVSSAPLAADSTFPIDRGKPPGQLPSSSLGRAARRGALKCARRAPARGREQRPGRRRRRARFGRLEGGSFEEDSGLGFEAPSGFDPALPDGSLHGSAPDGRPIVALRVPEFFPLHARSPSPSPTPRACSR
jgi:hypothetical protein